MLQTVTPVTETIKRLAKSKNIPIVGISETTQPPTALFQEWMRQRSYLIFKMLSKHSLRVSKK